jgi:hypothetical protein
MNILVKFPPKQLKHSLKVGLGPRARAGVVP